MKISSKNNFPNKFPNFQRGQMDMMQQMQQSQTNLKCARGFLHQNKRSCLRSGVVSANKRARKALQ